MRALFPLALLPLLVPTAASQQRGPNVWLEPPDLPGDLFHSQFGRAIDLDAGRLFVLDSTSWPSHVTVFRLEAGGPVLEQRLSARRTEHWETVAVEGDRAIVGDTFFEDRRGQVLVFERGAGGWALVQHLRVQTGLFFNSEFGRGLALRGDTIVVGAPRSHPFTNRSGSFYVFERDGGSFELVQTFRPPEDPETLAGELDLLGYDVALTRDTLAVGSPGTRGGVRLYVHDGESWRRAATVRRPEGASVEDFGMSVALDPSGSTLAVGAPHWTNGPAQPGHAFVFERTGAAWHLSRDLTAGVPGDSFGHDVALDEDRLVVGVPDRRIQGIETGAVLYFERTSAGWPEAPTRIFRPALSANEIRELGASVALDGGDVAGGAPFTFVPGVYGGSAFLWDIDLGQRLCFEVSGFDQARLVLAGRPEAGREDLELRLRNLEPGTRALLLASTGRSTRVFGQGELCVAAPQLRLDPVIAVGAGERAVRPIDFADPRFGGGLVAGSTWYFQAVYTDPESPSGLNPSNAVGLTFE